MSEEQSINIVKVVRYQLEKFLISDNIFTEKCIKRLDKFRDLMKGFLSFLICYNHETEEQLARDHVREELNKFLLGDFILIKNDNKICLNYIITFLKMIECGEFTDIKKDEKVTAKSLGRALNRYSNIDYYILLTVDILLNKFWAFMDTDNCDIFVKHINKLYMISRIINNEHLVKFGSDILYDEIKIPCVVP